MMPRTALPREMSVDQARADFDGLVAAIKQEAQEIILTEDGRTIARIVPSGDSTFTARMKFFREAERLREGFKGMPTRDLESLIDSAVTAVRAETKARHRR
jgi:antitoxin (DNA-binding transcriptional repressor) of toxin-antitoxin stability system